MWRREIERICVERTPAKNKEQVRQSQSNRTWSCGTEGKISRRKLVLVLKSWI